MIFIFFVLFQIMGFSCAVLVFLLQFLFVWLYYRHKLVEKKYETSKTWKIFRMLAFNTMQVIELIGNVACFRGFWNVLDAFFIPGF